MTKKHLSRIILSISLIASVSLTAACSKNSALDTRETDMSHETAYTTSKTDTTFSKPDNSVEIPKKEPNSTRELLKSYITTAQTECKQALYHATECMISLQNIFGDEKPEMILSIESEFPIHAGDYYFTINESGDPVYMGHCFIGHDKFYSDDEYVYSVKNLDTYRDRKIVSLSFNKLDEQIYAPNAPDLAEYKNSDAPAFINDINWFFLRYDDDDCFINPEKYAAMFYYEDSGLYEAYMVSTQMLDLTEIEIGNIRNGDGDLIHAYILGYNYLVSRQEYEKIRSKFFEMLTEVTEEPQISSGWIGVGDIDDWLEHLSNDINPTTDITAFPNASDDLREWLEENLWDILGNENLMNIPEVCDLVNPRSAVLYIADIDKDGAYELVHSLFTGTYTTINSVYKPNNGKLFFYGYYYSGLNTGEPDQIDGAYTYDGKQRYFCSKYVTSGGTGQPYWIQVYEIKFGDKIDLIPVISEEWAPQSFDGEYQLVKAEYNSGTIYDEKEYDQWLSDFFGGCVRTDDLIDVIDSMDVPFSIGFKDIFSEEDVQSIIDWICNSLQ